MTPITPYHAIKREWPATHHEPNKAHWYSVLDAVKARAKAKYTANKEIDLKLVQMALPIKEEKSA